MLAMGMASALVPVRVKADFPIGLVDVRAAMPLDANAELGSAYRCDLPGPEVWTSTCGDKALDGTADGYFKTEVPAGRFGVPVPGMSGLLHVVHMVPNVKDPVSLEIVEGNVRIALVPVRNHWTPSFMTTYYRSLPNAASPADEKRVGRIVLKERKAVLADNTFLAEATVKNTSSLSLACRVSVKTQGGLPVPGRPAKAWRFTTRSMGRDVERITCTASGTSFGGGAVALELPPHGERTFRYALAFSPESPADASVRVVRALADSDAFVANARAFNDWFARNVPRLETGNPDLLKMYLYRWFVVKRGTHDARRVVPDHEYPRRAVYESPVGGWYGCVIGLPVPVQIQEIAWMRDPGVLRDHVLNWCEKVRGYRGYIQYTGQAIARALENHPSEAFARQILPAVTQFARASAGKDPAKLPVQRGSWPVGAEYQPNFYQFTEPKWDFRHDAELAKKCGLPVARLVRLDTAVYAIGNLLGAAKLAETAGDASLAADLRQFAASQLEIVKSRHWDEKTGLFLAADPVTYRLADEAACYDSFAPYMWGLVNDARHLKAFDKFIDRGWFWDDFPASTCAKTCPMYNGANAIYAPPASIASPHYYGCSWNGPMWHYANTLMAEAFGQCALRRPEMRGKWIEFFDAWSESHWAYGDRTAPRAGEHYRPEDGAYCGIAWDYFHSSWIAPFFRYRCGVQLAKDGKSIVFEPFADEDFRVANVPLAGHEFTFEQSSGCLAVRDAAGRVRASGKGRVSFAVSPRDEPFTFTPPSKGRALVAPPRPARPKVAFSHVNRNESPANLLKEKKPSCSGDQTVSRCTFWPQLGTAEWVELSWEKPCTVTGLEVYWFDDEGKGSCRVPASFGVSCRAADGLWEKIDCPCPVEKDRLTNVQFGTPCSTDALRIDIVLRKGSSGGLLVCRPTLAE